MSSLLCLAGDGVATTLFAAALHIGWTPADGLAREESWHIRQGYFEFFAARIRKNSGKDAAWEHYWPTRAPRENLVPRARAPVVQGAPC